MNTFIFNNSEIGSNSSNCSSSNSSPDNKTPPLLSTETLMNHHIQQKHQHFGFNHSIASLLPPPPPPPQLQLSQSYNLERELDLIKQQKQNDFIKMFSTSTSASSLSQPLNDETDPFNSNIYNAATAAAYSNAVNATLVGRLASKCQI
jgi:hypothetical protein